MQPTILCRSTRFAEEYILGKCVGSGAFGTVHLAVHRTTGEEVAVKILSKTRAKQSREKTISKLQREVEVLQQLSPCANVVKLLNKYEDDSFAYLVMEYCSGGDLEQLIEVGGWITDGAAWVECMAASELRLTLEMFVAPHCQQIAAGWHLLQELLFSVCNVCSKAILLLCRTMAALLKMKQRWSFLSA